MKSLKLASISFALFFGLILHFILLKGYFDAPTLFERSFAKCALVTGVYFILFAASVGFFVIEPYQNLKEDVENKKDLFNWWWYIYGAGWCLGVLVFLEFHVWDYMSERVGRQLADFTLAFFFIKGIFLIPAFFVNRRLPEAKKILSMALFIFIEIMIVIIMLFGGWFLGQVGDIDL